MKIKLLRKVFFAQIRLNTEKRLTFFCECPDFGAVRRFTNLVDIKEQCLKMSLLVAKLALATEENEPSKVC